MTADILGSEPHDLNPVSKGTEVIEGGRGREEEGGRVVGKE